MSDMFPSPGSDRARLEEIVAKNCFHRSSGNTYLPKTCQYTAKSSIEKCSTHELLGTFQPERMNGLDRHTKAQQQEAMPSWCSVLDFYKQLLEKQNGIEEGSTLGDRLYRMASPEEVLPELVPEPDPPPHSQVISDGYSYMEDDGSSWYGSE